MTIETRIAKNGSQRYYVRDNNTGKRTAINVYAAADMLSSIRISNLVIINDAGDSFKVTCIEGQRNIFLADSNGNLYKTDYHYTHITLKDIATNNMSKRLYKTAEQIRDMEVEYAIDQVIITDEAMQIAIDAEIANAADDNNDNTPSDNNTGTKIAKFEAGKTYFELDWMTGAAGEHSVKIEKRTNKSVYINGDRYVIRVENGSEYIKFTYDYITTNKFYAKFVEQNDVTPTNDGPDTDGSEDDVDDNIFDLLPNVDELTDITGEPKSYVNGNTGNFAFTPDGNAVEHINIDGTLVTFINGQHTPPTVDVTAEQAAFDNAVAKSKSSDGWASLNINGEVINFRDGKIDYIISDRYGASIRFNGKRKTFRYRDGKKSRDEFFNCMANELIAAEQLVDWTDFCLEHKAIIDENWFQEDPDEFRIKIYPEFADGHGSRHSKHFVTKTFDAALDIVDEFKSACHLDRYIVIVQCNIFCGEVYFKHNIDGAEQFNPSEDEYGLTTGELVAHTATSRKEMIA